MGDLVLPYSAASDTRTGKPSPTSPVSEQKDGASCVIFVSSRPHPALSQEGKAIGDAETSSLGSRKEQLS